MTYYHNVLPGMNQESRRSIFNFLVVKSTKILKDPIFERSYRSID